MRERRSKGLVNDEPKRKSFVMIYQYLDSEADAERMLGTFGECQSGPILSCLTSAGKEVLGRQGQQKSTVVVGIQLEASRNIDTRRSETAVPG